MLSDKMAGISTSDIHAAVEVHEITDVMPPINVAKTYDSDNEKLVKLRGLSENSIWVILLLERTPFKFRTGRKALR